MKLPNFDAYGQVNRQTFDPNLALANVDPFLIARGDVANVTKVDKFGRAQDIGTTMTPVCSALVYKTPTAATALELVSSDVNDTAAGSGARSVTIEGLQTWSDDVKTVATYNLNGTSAVSAGSWLRVFRMYVASSGTYATQAAGSHAGTLTLRESGGGDTWADINFSSSFPLGQSLIGCYSVPSGYRAFIGHAHRAIEATKTPNTILFVRENADQTSAPYGAMRARQVFTAVSNEFEIIRDAPLGPYNGPCDLGFMAAVPSGTVDIEINFTMFIVPA